MKIRYYILIAVFSYLLFTIASTPAASVFYLVQKNTRVPFTLQGIDGSIWSGSAERLSIPSVPQLDNINWILNPFALLIARLNASIEADFYKNRLTGNISVNSSGDISASQIKTQLPGKAVQQLINLPLGEIDGDFIINIESLEMNKTLPVIHGSIQWHKATLTLADTVNLGNLNLTLQPSEDNSLNIKVNNKGGDLDIEGQINLSENKTYKIDLTFKPQASANNNIKQSLAMFARRQTNGSYSLKQTGNLRSLGF